MPRDIDVYIMTEAFPADDVDVMRVSGRERIGDLFQFDVDFVAKDPGGYDPEAMTGAVAALVFVQNDVQVRRVDGIIANVFEGLDDESGKPSYRLRLVPRAHILRLIHTQQVYLNTTVPDIIATKLQLCALEHELLLSGSYPEREFVVQYAETDLAFISRLAEHVGISFYLVSDDDREKLVLTDDQRFGRLAAERATVPFRGRGDRLDVFQLEREAQMIPRMYAVSDYNYRTPLVDLYAACESAVGAGGGVLEYGGHVKTPAEAEQLSVVRRQERECRRVVYRGQADRPDLGAGVLFQLSEHPLLGDVDLLVAEARHEVSPVGGGSSTGDVAYTNHFVAVSAESTYRPERTTPRPHIHGVMSGTVLPRPGSDGSAPWIDEQGRYTVRILFDSADHQGGKASHQIRMAQAHSGPGYGSHFPLRPNVEVIIAFIDGDVDRPIIVGAAPNALTPSPVVDKDALHHRIETAAGV